MHPLMPYRHPRGHDHVTLNIYFVVGNRRTNHVTMINQSETLLERVLYVNEMFCIWDILINMQIRWLHFFMATHKNVGVLAQFLILYPLLRCSFYVTPGVINRNLLLEFAYSCKIFLSQMMSYITDLMFTVYIYSIFHWIFAGNIFCEKYIFYIFFF